MSEQAEALAKAYKMVDKFESTVRRYGEGNVSEEYVESVREQFFAVIDELAAYRSQPSGFLPPGTVIDYMGVRATVLEGPFAWDAIPVQVEGDGVEVWNWDCDGVPCTVVSLPTPPSPEQKT